MEKAPLIVLDTNVLIAGLCRREDSPSFKILRNIQLEKVPVVLTQKLYLEYESVLTRSRILRLLHADLEDVRLVLDALVALARKSEVFYMWRPNLPDEKDNFVLEAAVATGAGIVTKNIRDFEHGELRFPGLVILTPMEFCSAYL